VIANKTIPFFSVVNVVKWNSPIWENWIIIRLQFFEQPSSIAYQCTANHLCRDLQTTTKFARENHLLRQARKWNNLVIDSHVEETIVKNVANIPDGNLIDNNSNITIAGNCRNRQIVDEMSQAFGLSHDNERSNNYGGTRCYGW
jgi:hypothetical protein